MNNTRALVESVGLVAPGMPCWTDAVAVLSLEHPPEPAYATLRVSPQPQLLPANERRRAPLSVLVALQAAEDAMRRSSILAADTPTVFASSDAEMAIVHRISSALAEPGRIVSPTDFHNSVHNAAAGYWGIGARSRRSATTLAAFDGTFAAGLREVFAMLADGERAVLLVLYDVPPPVPLYEKRPIETACGVALMFSAEPTSGSLACLTLEAADHESTLANATLETLRRGNPAARALPVLVAIARARDELLGIRTESGALLGVRIACR